MTAQTEHAFPSNNQQGVTARDYFAAAALICARPVMQRSATPASIAKYVYSIADAMMVERAK